MRHSSLSRAFAAVAHVVLVMMLAVELGFVVAGAAYAKTANGETVVVAGSDFQANWGGNEQSAKYVTQLLTVIKEEGGYATVDGIFNGGDYTYDYGVTKDASEAGIAAFKAAAAGVYPELNDSNMILVQGNHETAEGITGLSPSGENDSDDYGVFVINEDDFMWRSYLTQEGLTEEQATAIEQRTATNLMDYLNDKITAGYSKPIFVLLHVPLHYSGQTSGSGDGRNANYLFNVLNKGAKAGLNIICMFGHNHGWSKYEDFHGGGSVYLELGDPICIAQNSKTDYKQETLAFTYLNYGYTGYVGSAVDSALTMTVFTIGSDSVTVERYDNTSYWEGGVQHNGSLHKLKSAGSSSSTGALAADSKEYESPQTIELGTPDTTKHIDNYLAEEATDEEVAQTVIDMIDALPETASLVLSDKSAVEAARAAYEKLTDAQKELVTNLAALEADEARIAELEAAGVDLSEATVTLSPSSYTYSGTACEPSVTVTVGAGTLTLGTDYTVAYANNTNAGTATVTITGTGNYDGTKAVSFTIGKASVSSATVSTISAPAYTGSAITPEPTVEVDGRTLALGTDYSLAYADNTNAGTATVTITGKGNYEGTKTVYFNITTASISSAEVSAITAQTYTGSAITPEPTVTVGGRTLESGTDYTLSYEGNTNAGTATVTITGKGNYTGTKAVTFTIGKASVSSATVSTIAAQTYTGSAVTPTPTVKVGSRTLALGTDYTLSYSSNTNAGTATVTITGKGNYTGTKAVTFTIGKASVSSATVAAIPAQAYTGSAITPTPTVTVDGRTLESGIDYTLAYADNTNDGTATVTVTGTGNYEGTKTVNFEIVKETVSLSDATIAKLADATYTGSAITPTPAVMLDGETLSSDTDFTYSYDNNTNVGTATVTINGMGQYTGSASTTFTIKRAQVSSATVSSIAAQTYTGSAITPEPTVTVGGRTLALGTDYTLSYEGNTNAGTATVTITGTGNYEGTKTVEFLITLSFVDVNADTAHAEDIEWLAATGISTGWLTDEGAEFRPYDTIKRADLAAFLFRLAKAWGALDASDSWEPSKETVGRFRDVTASTSHSREIWWMAENGISTGWQEKDGTYTFRPYDMAKRADIAAFLHRMAAKSGVGTDVKVDPDAFIDVSSKTAHAEDIWWMAGAGISTGWKTDEGAEFRPYLEVKRCDMAAFLHRLDQLR